MKYRTEIDGLRALAIIPVVLFHAGFPYIYGGFVGVDIFFVISGYLITNSLLDDEGYPPLERLARFYKRRIRRIIPALVVVVLATLAVGVALLLPKELVKLGQSSVATALFSSNFWFWRQSGYFAGAAQSMPLLHTWSLAVEEQFYIGFPLFLIACKKLNLARPAIWFTIIALTILSFCISLYLSNHSPGAAFYWPTRAWELLIGSALSLLGDQRRPLREAISVAGLTLITASFFVLNENMPFPGYIALAPTLGTAAVIYGGGETLAGRLLSFRFLVFVGLISYSLYLWHWPVLVYAREFLVVDELSAVQAAICIALTVLLAVLSWRFIETPSRKRHVSAVQVFGRAAVASGAVLVSGLCLLAFNGLPSRFSQEALALSQAGVSERPEHCAPLGKFLCSTGEGKPRFILWGDSHAGAVSPAFANITKSAGLYAVFNACPPLPGFTNLNLRGDDKNACAGQNKAVLDQARSDDIEVVVLSAFWAAYEINESDVRSTLDSLKSKRVLIIGDAPTPGFDVPKILAFNRDAKQIKENRMPMAFDIIAEYPNVRIVNLSDALCSNGICSPNSGLNTLYADGNHISTYAAKEVISPYLKDRLSGLIP